MKNKTVACKSRPCLFRIIFVAMLMDGVSRLYDLLMSTLLQVISWVVKHVLSVIPTPHISIHHCWSGFLNRLLEVGISKIVYMGIWMSSVGNQTVKVWNKWLNAILPYWLCVSHKTNWISVIHNLKHWYSNVRYCATATPLHKCVQMMHPTGSASSLKTSWIF